MKMGLVITNTWSLQVLKLRLQPHSFLNLRLDAYINGNTVLSEYYICDWSKNTTKYEEKIP